MRLVIGPTCAGKSTFVEQLRKAAADEGRPINVHLAFQILDPAMIPSGADDVVHFNLLRGHLRQPNAPIATSVGPFLPELIEAAEEVTVLCAPRPVLVRRAQERNSQCEPDDEGAPVAQYPKLWTRALRMPKLAQIYEQLALHLDQAGKPYRYLCSNSDAHEGFHPISRWEFPRLATASSEQLCRSGHVPPKLEIAGRTYQSDFRQDAASAGRARTLSLALQMPLAGKTVLDIGCAEGAAALSAARMGAKVTGIEPMPRRFERARAIASALGTRIDLRNITLDDLGASPDSYDVVLALNVIHHQKNPFAFLDMAADLTASHLVLEYPGPADRKYRSTLSNPLDIPADQPVMGVSMRDQDQTFVFTPASLERYLLDTVAIFGKHEIKPSPIADRWLSVFSEKKGSAPKPQVTEENERLRKALATRDKALAARDAEIKRLKGTVHEMRASRSWRLTKPLRTIHTRLH